MENFRYEDSEIRRRNHKSDDGKKRHMVGEVVTVQAIICISLAIILLIFNLFAAKEVSTLHTEYQQYSQTGSDWWESIVAAWNHVVESVTKSQSKGVSSTQSAAGGEPNPFGPYNKVMAPPSYATFAPFIYSSTITVPVAGKVSSNFGYRYHPITGNLDFHKGIDIAAAYQTPIRAAISGKVTAAGENKSAGKYITLSHGNGLFTKYMHCSSIVAKTGAQIREGEVIAKVGSTGMSTGNHLHFQMEKDGIVFDPSWIVPFKATEN